MNWREAPAWFSDPLGLTAPGPGCNFWVSWESGQAQGGQALTIVTSPVDIDASAVVAGKLSQGEAGGVGCQGESVTEPGPEDYTASQHQKQAGAGASCNQEPFEQPLGGGG